MLRVPYPAQVPRDGRPVALAIGVFDGVHLGHRAVVRTARLAADRLGGSAWVLTFDPHPLQVLRPEAAPPAILPLEAKLVRLAALGVDGCIVHPFTAALAGTPAEAFLEGLLRDLPDLSAVAVGKTWRFGRGAAGDAALLRAFVGRRGIAVHTVPPVLDAGSPVSSTRIRAAVLDGRLAEAGRLLGDWFSLDGLVVPGRGLGRTLGYPTANIALPPGQLRPPPGIYAAFALVDDGPPHSAAVYLGARPTFGGSDPVIEVHLLDGVFSLYGRRLTVRLVDRIRSDAAFPDVDALRRQIASDIEAARRRLAGVRIDFPPPPA